MIIKVDDSYHSRVMSYLKKEPEFNLFILGDIERYGYDNYFFNIWAGIDKRGNIEGILLKYYEYLIFYSQGKFNAKEFSDFINQIDYLEISGKLELIDKLSPRLNINKKRIVNFCVLEDFSKLYNEDIKLKTKKIKFGNINKVVKLYEFIEEFEETTVENVKSIISTGRGYCIEMNRQVVAMAKSTLENNSHAMIVGVGTHPDYRNQGLATKCIVKICRELIKEEKIPCLFYDNMEAGKIYNKIGFKEKGLWCIAYR